MLKPLLFAALFILTQKPTKPVETGIIAGRVAAPAETTISQPLQIVLLPPQYSGIWESDVQQRLDGYWERYKPAFAQKKEYFSEVSQMAYREATQFIINRMRRDIPDKIPDLIQNSSPNGLFEFNNVVPGEYTVVALGRVGGQNFVWKEAININGPVPQFLELKKHIP